jgi:hypothetical protein
MKKNTEVPLDSNGEVCLEVNKKKNVYAYVSPPKCRRKS